VSDNPYIVATPAAAIEPGKPAVVRAYGDEVAIYEVGGEYFANSNFCTHALARLADGNLDGYILECPLHQALFDIRTGRCTGEPLMGPDLTSYEVQLRDGLIEIRKRQV
jgi:naphthalene 1,2-dioxygenase system ferredoxin subunit